jgi:hypothetical protein
LKIPKLSVLIRSLFAVGAVEEVAVRHAAPGWEQEGDHVAGARDYTEATKKALFALSLGRCYARECSERVTQMDGDVPVIKVQIAHIRAASKNGPRFDANMTDDERRGFPNLLLLCTYHHASVDGKETGERYPVKTLAEWKGEREGGLSIDLVSLTEDVLRDALDCSLREVIGELKGELLAEIKKVEEVTGETASLLRTLVKETFDRPCLDPDTVASLADSSRALSHLDDIAPILYESSRRLQDLPDYAFMLDRSSHALQILPDYVGMLDRTTHALMALPDHAPMLQEAAKRLQSLPDSAHLLGLTVSRIEEAASNAVNLLDNAHSVDKSPYLVKLDLSTKELQDASAELALKADQLVNSAHMAANVTGSRQPDRMTYFLRGVVTCATAVAVIGILVWILVARSKGA